MQNAKELIDIYIIEWSEAELACAERDRAATNRAVSALCGRYAARLCGADSIAHEPSGRPYIEGQPDVFISISHCGRLCAVSCGGIPHGVDIERPRPFRESMTRRVFAPEEDEYYSSLEPGGAREDFFFRTWTRKEALIKCGALTLGTMREVCALGDTVEAGGTFFTLSTFAAGGAVLSLCRAGCFDTAVSLLGRDGAPLAAL